MARSRLFARHTQYARSVALDAWVESHGDPDKAKELAARRLRADPGSIIGTILLGLAIKLMAELIMYWFTNNMLRPTPTYLSSEPGYRGFDQ